MQTIVILLQEQVAQINDLKEVNKMKTTNRLELTETQKKIILEILLREMQSINNDVGKYAINENISKFLKEHKEKVHEIYQMINVSMEDE